MKQTQAAVVRRQEWPDFLIPRFATKCCKNRQALYAQLLSSQVARRRVKTCPAASAIVLPGAEIREAAQLLS